MTMMQTAISFFSSRINTQKSNLDNKTVCSALEINEQTACTLLEMPEEGKFQEGISKPTSFTVERSRTNENLLEGRNEYCEGLVNEQLNEADKKLDDLLLGLDKDWIKKTALGAELEEVKATIIQAKEVIDEARNALDINNLQHKWKALEAVILKIGKNLALLNIPAISNHETINGVFNLFSLAGIAAWTYLANHQKINESTPGYILIPLVVNIIPNVVKVLTLIKVKANKIQIEDKNILDATYRSLTPNLETLAKTVYEEKTENKMLRAESRLFLRLSQDRRSYEVQNACFHHVLPA